METEAEAESRRRTGNRDTVSWWHWLQEESNTGYKTAWAPGNGPVEGNTDINKIIQRKNGKWKTHRENMTAHWYILKGATPTQRLAPEQSRRLSVSTLTPASLTPSGFMGSARLLRGWAQYVDGDLVQLELRVWRRWACWRWRQVWMATRLRPRGRMELSK